MGKLQDDLKSYSKTLLDHFENPRNLGSLPDATLTVTAENPSCQDIVKMSVRMRDGRIDAVRYKVLGCTVAIASSSVLSELIDGRREAELRSVDRQALVRALGGLPDHKLRCTGAALGALEKILEQIDISRSRPAPPRT
jgi:nitrogen fixation NifU-like protein